MNASAIFVAAGESKRFGGERRKPFVLLRGRPLFLHTIERFAGVASIRERLLVVRAEDAVGVRSAFDVDLERLGVKKIVAGGARRQDSVRAALRECDPSCDFVLVHDAVRPLVTRDAIEEVMQAAAKRGAAILAVPAKDTLKLGSANGCIERTLPRANVWRAQTPQVFSRDLLERAFAEVERRGLDVTDDAEMVEAIGATPVLVRGSESNVKVTEPSDLAIVEALLALESRESKSKGGG